MKVRLSIQYHNGKRRKNPKIIEDVEIACSEQIDDRGNFRAYKGMAVAAQIIVEGRVDYIGPYGFTIVGFNQTGCGKYVQQTWYCITSAGLAALEAEVG